VRKTRRPKKARPEDTTFTKIGRSLTNFFGGSKKK